jgi:hypothetical protein
MKIIIQEEYLQHEKNKVHRIFAIIPFFFGTTGIITVLAFDKYYWKVGILTEGWPDFSLGFSIRSIVIFISVFAIFYSLTKWNHEKLNHIIKDEWNIERWSIVGLFIVSLVFLFMFFFTTSAFSAYSKEDSVVEWGSFIFLIFSSLLFILSFIAGQKNSRNSKLLKWMLLLPAFAFFVMGMEEISWFQRVVEFNTPELAINNMQNEFNLHNFATSKVENAYYFSAFLFLVVLPYFRNLFPTFLNDDRIEVLVPRPFISILGAFACAYNFDMWNIIFTQISFAGTVSILISYSVFTKTKTGYLLILPS